jgi:LAO/AO transport system kinase
MPKKVNHPNRNLSVNHGNTSPGSINPHYRHQPEKSYSIREYVDEIQSGNRTVLSQVITLIESTKPENRTLGEQILEKCLPFTGNSVRIGITGVPGAGKSTFIESFGKHLVDEGYKVAVLAIDPSSSRTKGSILGDKTRMPGLSSNENAYVRPSPTSGSLGGVARTSRETMLLCEAAGFNLILIETVGVGQSETTVHSMVDFFLLLMIAGAGDELQGIKRGIMEMADLIAINKIDEQDDHLVQKSERDIKNALSLFPISPSGWEPPVMSCSALQNTGISDIWLEISNYLEQTHQNGFYDNRRSEQLKQWMHETIRGELQTRFYNKPEIKSKLPPIERKVINGQISPFRAADELLKGDSY